MTFNEETLNSIFAHLERQDERLDALEEQLDPAGIAVGAGSDDPYSGYDQDGGEIEGLIAADEEVDYDALAEDV